MKTPPKNTGMQATYHDHFPRISAADFSEKESNLNEIEKLDDNFQPGNTDLIFSFRRWNFPKLWPITPSHQWISKCLSTAKKLLPLKKERNDAIVLACLQIYRRERERELILCFGEFQLYRALAQKFALPRKCGAILLLIKHRGALSQIWVLCLPILPPWRG